MKRIFSLCVLLAVFSTAALADVRLPDKPKPTPAPAEKKALETYLHISIRGNVKEARLLIPKDQIKELRAQLDELDGGPNRASALGFSRAQTIIGGLFLSLAFVAGGVWFTRARKGGIKPKMSVAAGALLLSGGAFALVTFANVGPPLEARSITGKIFTDSVHMYKQASGKIKVEMTDDSSGIELIVPDAPRDKKAVE